MRGRLRALRRTAVTALAVLLTVGLAVAPAEAVSRTVLIQEQDPAFEARFPDILKLDDGRLMVVYHRAVQHQDAPGMVMLMVRQLDGRWDPPVPALATTVGWRDRDMRDPKLGKMHDGSVVLTFFVPGDGVHYAVWKPGWTRFTAPEKLDTGLSESTASHGSVLALAGTDEVLVPFYTGAVNGGAWYRRMRWRPVDRQRLQPVGPARKFLANENQACPRYAEPSFVQIQTTVVAAVRVECAPTAPGQRAGARAVVIAKWQADDDVTVPDFQPYRDPSTGNPVLASSHHLLKTSNDQILFTYGDRTNETDRPTHARLITEPLQPWPLSAKVVPLYNSGGYDQANPSSVELSPGVFWTLAYNAKHRPASPTGGTLYTIRSTVQDDY